MRTVIVSARRTPMGMFQGRLAACSATQLGATVLAALRQELHPHDNAVDEILMGCVLPAGVGQAPARQAALQAGFPVSVPCTTVNKVCGSGMKTILIGCQMIDAGAAKLVIAGGMESMSNAPYVLDRQHPSRRIGHRSLRDHMLCDGLEDPVERHLMGYYAEQCADRMGISREEQDALAIASLTRALQAQLDGAFADEIVEVQTDHEAVGIDEGPGQYNASKITRLKPVFRPQGGTVTAANSSSIADGAAAVVLTEMGYAETLGCQPLARILGYTTHARQPSEFTIAPAGAVRALFDKLSWTDRDVDLYEINEAFAVVTLAAERDLGIDHAKVNVNGGSCALGHPVGATGSRIVVTLIHALKQRGLHRGVATLCIGGGEATALAIEVL